MEKHLYVVIENGKKYGFKNEKFTWSAWDEEEVEQIYIGATNFADGYTRALMAQGFNFGKPYVMSLDGYWWKHGEMTIKIINDDGKVIRKPEDI